MAEMRGLAALALVLLVLAASGPVRAGGFPGGHKDAYGPLYELSPTRQTNAVQLPDAELDPVRRWNRIAVDASGLDHTPLEPGERRVFGEQYGPTRASRAMAIVHIAIFDAVNSIAGGSRNYAAPPPPPHRRPRGPIALAAAVAQAAHDALIALFPSQKANLDDLLARDLARIPIRGNRDERYKRDGVELGRRTASAILALRTDDGSDYAEPYYDVDYLPSDLPGHWRQDPISLIPICLGAYWYKVHPFVMDSASQFRGASPPALTSRRYAAAFNEVKRLGGDGVTTPTERTEDQTFAGTYWAYDGTPSLCAPPRLYNQLLTTIADQMGSDVVEVARLLALANVAMADAAIAIWESKYHYDFWRPVTGVREADKGTGPTGLGDGNPKTAGDETFSPLGAPASNLSGPNFTPPFPSYPSGHAGFGGTVFQILRRFYGTDDIAFTFVSDEFNGETVDSEGSVRPLLPRSFETLSQAEEENGQSRIYLGIHWAFDKKEGIRQGRAVADYVFDNAFRTMPPNTR